MPRNCTRPSIAPAAITAIVAISSGSPVMAGPPTTLYVVREGKKAMVIIPCRAGSKRSGFVAGLLAFPFGIGSLLMMPYSWPWQVVAALVGGAVVAQSGCTLDAEGTGSGLVDGGPDASAGSGGQAGGAGFGGAGAGGADTGGTGGTAGDGGTGGAAGAQGGASRLERQRKRGLRLDSRRVMTAWTTTATVMWTARMRRASCLTIVARRPFRRSGSVTSACVCQRMRRVHLSLKTVRTAAGQTGISVGRRVPQHVVGVAAALSRGAVCGRSWHFLRLRQQRLFERLTRCKDGVTSSATPSPITMFRAS